jgi:hypothetical protein
MMQRVQPQRSERRADDAESATAEIGEESR